MRLAQRLTVAIRPTGLVVPGYDGDPDLPLTLADLEAIEALAAGAEADALPDSPTLTTLADRGLLLDAGATTAERDGASTLPDVPDVAPATTTAGEYVLSVPVLLACRPGGFEYVDHDGVARLRLSAVELVAIATFRRPTTVDDALEALRAEGGHSLLDHRAFTDLAGRALAAGFLVVFDPDDPIHAREALGAERMRRNLRRLAAVHAEFDRLESEHDESSGTVGNTRVIGFHTNWASPPTSLGMILAAAKAHQGGALSASYDFRPRLMWDRERLAQAAAGPPAIFLFSNYVWSSANNLAHSELVKAANPHHVTVHGGPDTPKYPGDLERYFAQHPHVDITVHGEGEVTFPALLEALAGTMGDGPTRLTALADVAGLSFRDGDRVVQTGPRDRLADLNVIPSPALTGLFDGFLPVGGGQSGLIIETNRGCPYGCTFCDWGSATLSRIRQFDLDRVFGELEWCATHELGIGLADANFGIFERDVEIAEKIAQLKQTYGYPRIVGNNYAKNTVKHLSKIIDIFTAAGIVAEGKMSMQTFDSETLTTIRRKNIKVEKYHGLSVEFRRNDLPLAVELMMGLPGATPATFRSDLQACIDRDVRATVFPTVLLPNSPMNEPEYRRENGIVALPGEKLLETATYTRDDYDGMLRLRHAFYLFENFGILRQVALYARSETGRREIEFYEQLVDDGRGDPERWPTIAIVLQVLPEMMVPPVSWRRFNDEIHRYLVEVTGLADDDALATVLAVQHLLTPGRGRQFPASLELPHDYVAWHAAVAALREAGHHDDWPERATPLRAFGPGALTVDDPLDSCGQGLGFPSASLAYFDSTWDMDSPISRPRQATSPEEAVG